MERKVESIEDDEVFQCYRFDSQSSAEIMCESEFSEREFCCRKVFERKS